MKPVLAFDVNETLLNLKALDPIFKQIFGDSAVRQLWFGQFIQNAFVTIITDSYQPFGKIGLAALEMTAVKKNIQLKDSDRSRIMDGIKNLPPHTEVPEALTHLKNEGFRMVTLTNSTEEVGKAQIKNSGLEEYFERVISAEKVKKLKPAKEPYEFAAHELNIQTKDLILIASHAWDIAGALNAECNAAFVARPGAVLDPLVPQPTIIGNNLKEVAEQIIKLYE